MQMSCRCRALLLASLALAIRRRRRRQEEERKPKRRFWVRKIFSEERKERGYTNRVIQSDRYTIRSFFVKQVIQSNRLYNQIVFCYC